MTASHTAGPPQVALRRIADLPGPPARPLVGNLFQLRRDVIHQGIERWCRQYGSLFKFRIGRRQLVVVADHALIAEVLRDRPHGWRRTQQLQVVSREIGLKPGLFGSEGDA
jgi:cytochrome P450